MKLTDETFRAAFASLVSNKDPRDRWSELEQALLVTPEEVPRKRRAVFPAFAAGLFLLLLLASLPPVRSSATDLLQGWGQRVWQGYVAGKPAEVYRVDVEKAMELLSPESLKQSEERVRDLKSALTEVPDLDTLIEQLGFLPAQLLLPDANLTAARVLINQEAGLENRGAILDYFNLGTLSTIAIFVPEDGGFRLEPPGSLALMSAVHQQPAPPFTMDLGYTEALCVEVSPFAPDPRPSHQQLRQTMCTWEAKGMQVMFTSISVPSLPKERLSEILGAISSPVIR